MKEKVRHSEAESFGPFSILIPSWNNLEYLQLCLRSLRENSVFKNQIIVFVNEGKDGTVEWLHGQPDVDFIHAEENRGVCFAVNACRTLAKNDYLVYLNDDMYVCPGWDGELKQTIDELKTDSFYLSASLIEPVELNNPNYVAVIRDFGRSPGEFREKELLASCKDLQRENWKGSSWPPSVVHKKLWDLVGGFSIEFSPGMYSDPDFSMKLWQAGVRIFMGVGSSLVYHFGAKSTGRVRKNKGSDTFLRKWGITANTFYSQVLKLGETYTGPYPQQMQLSAASRLRNKLKLIVKSF